MVKKCKTDGYEDEYVRQQGDHAEVDSNSTSAEKPLKVLGCVDLNTQPADA